VDVAISFAWTPFRPFTTQAFNKNPLEKPMEITDRAQLRALLRTNRMVDHGSTTNNYFGSDPKSIPTFEEIAKHGKPQDEEAMKRRSKLVKVSKDPVGDIKKLELAADQTDFGRRSSATRPEFVVGRP
jgi:hypothetical protein